METADTVKDIHLPAFKAEDTELRVRRNRIACLLALFGTGSGVSLDLILYPDSVAPLLATRLSAVALIFLVFKLHATDFGRRNIVMLNVSWALIVNLSICVMVFISEGASSPYYAGLNLVFLGAGVMLPWTLREMLVMCLLTLGSYIVACVSRGVFGGHAIEWSLLFNNCFFVFLTGLISSTSSFFTTKARIRDFNLRQELDSQNRKLQDLDRLKSQFFANVSHELRTPLTLILAPIQDVLKQPESLSTRMASLMRTARENALRLLKLVNDLLDVIKLEEGKSTLSLNGVELNEFVSGVSNSMIHMAEPREIELKQDLADEELIVQADVYALERIFLNLLSNAIKFTTPGGAITVRTRREGDQVVAEVVDTGVGIPEADIPYIFDRFRQVDSSSTRKHQGSGLGLALVKDLAEKMGGSVEVRSEVNVGTSLVIRLPAHDGPVEGAPSPADRGDDSLAAIHQSAEQRAALPISSPFEEIESRLPEGEEPSLMIVDDEPDMRQYLVSFLEGEYRISQVRDGKQALDLARKYVPNLMLLDLMLPEMDGHEVCKRLKSDPETRNIKIILLTARIDEEAKITALKNGADDFLTKPFSRSEVETRLRNLLETSRLETELVDRNTQLENTLTELKQTQANLVRSEKLNALGGLAAGLLHEVNNPLNYVISAIQLARMEDEVKSNKHLAEYFDDIDEGVGRIRNIVTDLHTFAHPSEVEKSRAFPLKAAVDTALRFTSSETSELKLTRNLVEEDVVLGSQGHIVQVLVNLLTNACHAVSDADSEEGGAIEVRSERLADRMRVSVVDNGRGMDLETKERVFEPFFTTKDVGQGMGLGLSICYTIIKNHGGEMQVSSQEGQGATFTFDLPLDRNQSVENLDTASGLLGLSKK